AGTSVVKDIVPGVGEGNPGPFAVVNNRLYFFATDPATGTELWVSDGTNAGTVLLKDINPGAGSSVSNNPFAANLLVSGNRMFFPATDGTTGIEPWTSDGTTPGTVLAKDVNPGAGNGMASLTAIAYPVGVGGKAAFAGDDGVNGSEPWISNGTAAGTTMIANLFPGSTGSSPGQFLTNNAASSILFPATDNVVGRELFAMAAVNVGAALLDPYGVGCPGTGGKIPQISAGAPVIGNAGFSVDVSNAYGPSASALILGVAPAAVPFGPCTIYVDLSLPNLVLSSTTNAAGNGSFSLPLPAVSSYVGISLYFQYLVIDPAGSFLGAATLTGGLRAQLGD
ncbi:MAG: hypothetical protein IT458_12400, partial [Planctomycetes bacterium]|nr:hypothetical protein [Planctomycetota bacterium]